MESGDKQTPAHENAIKALEYSLNVLNHALIGFIAIFMIWLCLHSGLQATSLHAFLVTIGFVLLMSEGIMCHYPANVLTFTFHRNTKTTVHWVLQALGGGLGIIGILVELIHRGFLLFTTHGRLGLVALILCVFSMLSGLSALFSIRLKNILSPLLNKTVHNVLGYTAFLIAILTQFTGYVYLHHFGYKADFQYLIKIITIISLALTSIGPLKACLRKIHMVYQQYVN